MTSLKTASKCYDKTMKINELAELLGVSSSTLRHWEKELTLDVPRNDLGHRTYPPEWVQYFQDVKRLLDAGKQYSEIKDSLKPPQKEPPAPVVPPEDLERLKQKLNDLAEDVSGLESSLGKALKERQALKKEIASLQSENAALQERITGLQSEVTSLQSLLNSSESEFKQLMTFKNRFWVYMGVIVFLYMVLTIGVVESIR